MKRKPVRPAVAIADLADPPAPPVTPAPGKVRVAFTRDRSLIAKAIGWDGGEELAHMTQFVSDVMVIDARAGWTKVNELAPGVEPDLKRWRHNRDGSWSIPPGVQRRPAAYLDENEDMVTVEIPCTLEQQKSFESGLEGQLGDAYDTRGIEDFFDGHIIDPVWHGGRHPCFCNALGIWRIEVSGISPVHLIPPYRRTPGAAFDICSTLSGTRITYWRGSLIEKLAKASGFKLPQVFA